MEKGTRDVQMIGGRNAVIEALRTGKTPDTVYIAEGELSGSIGKIKALARESGAVVETASRRKLDEMAQDIHYKGVLAMFACAEISIG